MNKIHRPSWTLACLVAAPAALAQHADLEEIVVTANPLRVGATDLVQSAVVLAGDDLSRRVSSSLGETLAGQPGITASFFGPRASRPIIRGLSGERVLMLQNGVGALDVSNLSPDHSVGIEEILADQVEVLKGPSTLLYGSGAVGGVVNVVDGRIPPRTLEGWSGVGELRGESVDDELSAAGRIDGRTGAFGVHAHAYYRETDDYDIPGYAWSDAAREEALEHGEEPDLTRGTVANSDSETRGGALGASWFHENFRIGLAWSRHETDYGLPGPGGHAHEEDHEHEADSRTAFAAAAEDAAGDAVRIDQSQDRFDFEAQWSEPGGPFSDVLLRAAYNDYRHDELEGDAVGTQFDQQGYDLRLQLGHVALAGWSGTLGVQYTGTDLDARGDEAYVPPSQTDALALFVVERQLFGPRAIRRPPSSMRTGRTWRSAATRSATPASMPRPPPRSTSGCGARVRCTGTCRCSTAISPTTSTPQPRARKPTAFRSIATGRPTRRSTDSRRNSSFRCGSPATPPSTRASAATSCVAGSTPAAIFRRSRRCACSPRSSTTAERCTRRWTCSGSTTRTGWRPVRRRPRAAPRSVPS